MKKGILLGLIVALIFVLSAGTVSTTYASELNEVYTYQDESINAVFTLKDETSYECNGTNPESGDTVDFSGNYVKQGNRIIFYLAGEVFLEAEVGENNTLTMADSEAPEEPILPDTELDELKVIEAYTTQIVEWIIAGVLGLLGTSAVAIVCRKHLKNLDVSVVNGISLLKTNKDKAEEDITIITKKAQDSIATLEKLKDEVLEQDKEKFLVLEKQIKLLLNVILSLVDGTKELVVNGTAEHITNMLNDINKEVMINASKG